MSMKVIDQLRSKLESVLAADKVDKNEVLKLSVELDKYIVEYIRNNISNKVITDNDKNHD